MFNEEYGVDSESCAVGLGPTNRRERCELKLKNGLVMLTLLLLTLSTSAWANEMAPVNPAFQRYMERSKGLSAGDMLNGRTPSPVDLSHLAGLSVSGPHGKRGGFPAAYDLRDLGFVTPVRSQDPYGSCWTFSATASLESTALKAGLASPDYSEQFLAYFGYVDQSPSLVGFGNYSASDFPGVMNRGGDDFKAIALLARGTGAVNEADAPYGSVAPSASAPVSRFLRNVFYFYYDSDTQYQKASIENIKQALMSHGAVSVGMYAGDPQTGNWNNSPYFNPSTYASYIPSGNPDGLSVGRANHAVTVVGWDDDYSRNNFNPANRPPYDGAWIVKNSWGSTTWGDKGYFYLSYYDAVIDTGAAYVGGDPATYDTVYQYDPLGWTGSFKPSGSANDTAWMANVFTASEDSDLRAVSFYAGGVGNSYSISVYTGSVSGPISGTKAIDGQVGTLQAPGYYTVPLASSVALTSGQSFSVVVRLTTPGYSNPIAIEARVEHYSDKASASPGQSYFSPDGSSWTDMTTFDPTANVCLKAFAARRSSPAPASLSVTITPAAAVSAGAKWSVDGGGVWNDSGASLAALAPGDYTVSYRPIRGWATPSPERINLTSGSSRSLSGIYQEIQVGSISVAASPLEAKNSSQGWRVSGDAIWASFDVARSMDRGTYRLEFGDVSGDKWYTPVSRDVIITGGETTSVSGVYIKKPDINGGTVSGDPIIAPSDVKITSCDITSSDIASLLGLSDIESDSWLLVSDDTHNPVLETMEISLDSGKSSVVLSRSSDVSSSDRTYRRTVTFAFNYVTGKYEIPSQPSKGWFSTYSTSGQSFELKDGSEYESPRSTDGFLRAVKLMTAPLEAKSPTPGPGPSPDPNPSAGGGGCSVGLHPGLLLLALPVVFFRK